jgi:hypothetical protein
MSETNLAITGNTLEEIEQSAKIELPIMIDWLHANRLSLNIKKIIISQLIKCILQFIRVVAPGRGFTRLVAPGRFLS